MVQQPFMYSAPSRPDSRFPTATFDPKAVTRASWEPKPRKAALKGPLVSFDLHPDYHVILPHRSGNYTPLDLRIKAYITWLRRAQLALRGLQLIAAIGVLVLFSLFTGVDDTTAWAMRILQAITITHSAYAIYHLSRDAVARAPASSAAYHFGCVVLDSGAIAGYVLGALTLHKNATNWGIVFNNQDIMPKFTSAVLYTAVGAGSLHLITLSSSAWLGWLFRKISLMPPDMNPLEDNLTARPAHKRNKSSLSTTTSYGPEAEKPWLESRRNSASVYEGVPERVSVSFMHTRTESRDSAISMGSRISASPERKKAPLRYQPRASNPISYSEVPSHEPETSPRRVGKAPATQDAETRRPPAVSRALMPGQRAVRSHRSSGSKSYAALENPYSMGGISSDSEGEESTLGDILRQKGRLGITHPKPLTSNPILPKPLNARNTRRGQIDFDAQYEASDGEPTSWLSQDIEQSQEEQNMRSQRYRDSSIQLDSHFDTRHSSGDEVAAGPTALGSGRKVSSGNDFWLNPSAAYERRRVSVMADSLPLPSVERPFGIHLWPLFSKAFEYVAGYPAEEFDFVVGKTPMSTLRDTSIFVAIYYLIIFGGRELMRAREPFKLKTFFLIHNFVLTAVSAILLALFIEQLLPTIVRRGTLFAVCDADGGWTQPLVVLYYMTYLTKYLELLDTIFLFLKKKPLTFLHCYHHGATAVLCYTQLIGSTSVQWVPISLNLFVHVVMYWYYFQSACGVRIWWKEWVTRLQIIQFVIDLGFVYFASYTYFTFTYWPWMPNWGNCAGKEFAAYSGIIVLSSYLVLFISFYFATYANKGRKSAAQKSTRQASKASASASGVSAHGEGYAATNGSSTRSRKAKN
ncbi:uncharacterized protein Triagg1_9817 [Trichoderma aggressivum f. europaeum]|uniref:Elongation of fatty acids protein n=1 Tax=Trichoderma aggressivum f. europaeum TaxID=173218 RepID=A0AAE1I6G5_9HYPO|nr:hypothetical protein Triagg1_9817 [Trichoderma aggressivum f. europaeum]